MVFWNWFGNLWKYWKPQGFPIFPIFFVLPAQGGLAPSAGRPDKFWKTMNILEILQTSMVFWKFIGNLWKYWKSQGFQPDSCNKDNYGDHVYSKNECWVGTQCNKNKWHEVMIIQLAADKGFASIYMYMFTYIYIYAAIRLAYFGQVTEQISFFWASQRTNHLFLI